MEERKGFKIIPQGKSKRINSHTEFLIEWKSGLREYISSKELEELKQTFKPTK